MARIPPGIRKISTRGRIGRDGKRRPGERYEVKAYNPASKKTEYVARCKDLETAKEKLKEAHRKSGVARRGSARSETWKSATEGRYLVRTTAGGMGGKAIKRSTLKANRAAVKPFLEEFGSRRLSSMDEAEIVAWCETQPGYVVEGVRSLFSWAVRVRLLAGSPMRFVTSRRTVGRKYIHVIATADLELLVTQARRSRAGVMGTRLAVLLILLAYSGMRPSEAFALRPENLDMDQRRIHVDWQLDEAGDFQPLKNERKRKIVMSPEVHSALPELLDQLQGNELLFVTARNCKLNTKSKWAYYWDPIRKAVEGLEDFDVYELRHYCATIMTDNGIPSEDVAVQLGHSDGGQLVRKLYAHPDEDLRLKRIDQAMRNRKHDIERRNDPEPPR